MKIKCLHDLRSGDIVAFKQYAHCPWFRDEVIITTARSIIIKSEPEVNFKKTNGLATRKEDAGYQISIVTPEIQDDWDRRKYQHLIRNSLDNNGADIPFDVIKEATILLLSQNEYPKSFYVQCLKEILFSRSASSASLKKVFELLQNADK